MRFFLKNTFCMFNKFFFISSIKINRLLYLKINISSATIKVLFLFMVFIYLNIIWNATERKKKLILKIIEAILRSVGFEFKWWGWQFFNIMGIWKEFCEWKIYYSLLFRVFWINDKQKKIFLLRFEYLIPQPLKGIKVYI